MIKYLFAAFLFLGSVSYGQTKSYDTLNAKLYLFGEVHSVGEKYDEMKVFILEKLDTVSAGQKVTMFFELPTSLNYALNKITSEGDTTLFLNWFNNLYRRKGEAPSYFWTDYRDFILDLISFSNEKGFELKLRGIDYEMELRRTAYILASFEEDIIPELDSFLNLDYISKDSNNRLFLLNYVSKALDRTTVPSQIETLKLLKIALTIDCTICRERDLFMYNNFIHYFDSSDVMSFATFGLDHVINKPDFSNVGEYFKLFHNVDTVNHKSFSSFLEDEFKPQVFRIGIISSKTKFQVSKFKSHNDYSHIMTKDERKYIEMMLENKEVVRIYPSEHKALSNLASHLDYLIIYMVSGYR